MSSMLTSPVYKPIEKRLRSYVCPGLIIEGLRLPLNLLSNSFNMAMMNISQGNTVSTKSSATVRDAVVQEVYTNFSVDSDDYFKSLFTV